MDQSCEGNVSGNTGSDIMCIPTMTSYVLHQWRHTVSRNVSYPTLIKSELSFSQKLLYSDMRVTTTTTTRPMSLTAAWILAYMCSQYILLWLVVFSTIHGLIKGTVCKIGCWAQGAYILNAYLLCRHSQHPWYMTATTTSYRKIFEHTINKYVGLSV